MAGFAVVEIKSDTPMALPGPQASSPEPPPMMVEAPSASPGVIEVELSGGVRLRVGSDVDGAALQRVLAALSAS
jgi:transposase